MPDDQPQASSTDAHPQQAPTLSASYFDGRSARAKAVTLRLQGDTLRISGEGLDHRVPLREVQWPERTRHGLRVAHFRDGGAVQNADAAAWDAWARSSNLGESLVVKAQQSWRWVLGSAVALVCLLVALQQWGVPVAARALVTLIPPSVDVSLGEASLAVIDSRLMRPSQLPVAEQQRLRTAFEQAVGNLPPDSVPPWRLVFRKSRIGPNAFALPGGTIVLTDELVKLVEGNEQVVTAVLAHELGHVRQRHGLRLLVQTTALGGLASLVVGDFSTVLAGVPALLGQASYSRDAEREADTESVRVLRAARISPEVMVGFFDKVQALRASKAAGKNGGKDEGKDQGEDDSKDEEKDSWLGIAIASHPTDAERVRFFREAAQDRLTGTTAP